jgi:hypothetical protein
MTLVLATFLDDAVLMGADSCVGYKDSHTGEITGYGMDQKLFIFTDVAIATFGEGVDVPKMINAGLQSNITYDEAIAFLLREFRGQIGVQAFVGSVTSSGPQLTRVWPSKKQAWPLCAELGESPPIWSAGCTEEEFKVAAGSLPEAIEQQMLGLFKAKTGEANCVGPPFNFVERRRDRRRNRNWEATI